ncbi:hypothetical protein GOP47_0030759 [Adiantum capillus-veneris]|nr:hypothetical protein GOP47_0030759 [Adiantum capillus-veneris]
MTSSLLAALRGLSRDFFQLLSVKVKRSLEHSGTSGALRAWHCLHELEASIALGHTCHKGALHITAKEEEEGHDVITSSCIMQ